MSELTVTGVLFALAGATTVAFGVRLTQLADELAQRSRLGRIFIGAVLLGALTSLPEIGTSLTAAMSGHAELATTNAIGSIAAQTAFIAVADLAYRRANLEHAAASVSNLMLVALLLLLLGVAIAAVLNPEAEVWSAHPSSYVLVLAYLFGMHLVSQSGAMPMWRPRETSDTDDESGRTVVRSGTLPGLWLRFVLIGCVVAGAGAGLAHTGASLAALTGLSQSFVGTLMTGVTSSLPELITAITAVRMGALTLAIANIVGGNLFDLVVVALSDFVYRSGSIYRDAGADVPIILTVTLMMNAVALLGLLRRERHGFGNIGLEGVLLLGLYGSLVYVVA